VPCGFLFSDARATSCYVLLSALLLLLPLPLVGMWVRGEKGEWEDFHSGDECEEKNLFRRSERAAFVVKLGFSILEKYFLLLLPPPPTPSSSPLPLEPCSIVGRKINSRDIFALLLGICRQVDRARRHCEIETRDESAADNVELSGSSPRVARKENKQNISRRAADSFPFINLLQCGQSSVEASPEVQTNKNISRSMT
jgi:hypothetical protein